MAEPLTLDHKIKRVDEGIKGLVKNLHPDCFVSVDWHSIGPGSGVTVTVSCPRPVAIDAHVGIFKLLVRAFPQIHKSIAIMRVYGMPAVQ